MVDNVDAVTSPLGFEGNEPSVKVETVQVVIGPATPVDTKTGVAETSKEVNAHSKERTYTKENFLAERQFVGSRLKSALKLPPQPVLAANSSPEAQTAHTQALVEWNQVKAVYDRLTDPAQRQEISGKEWDSLRRLQVTFPPLLAIDAKDPDQQQKLDDANTQRQTDWGRVIEYYYGSGTEAALQEEGSKVRRTEVEAFQQSARDLGFVTTASASSENSFLSQLLAEGFDNILTPEEILAAMPDFNSDQRAIFTPADFDPNSKIWQGFFQETPALVESKKASGLMATMQVLNDNLKQQPVLRVFFQNKLKGKITELEQNIFLNSQKGFPTAELSAEKTKLEKKLANFKNAAVLNERSQGLLERMKTLYQNITSQSPEVQQAWLSYTQEAQGEMSPEIISAKIKALAGLLGIENIDAALLEMVKPGKKELLAYKGAKLGFSVGAITALFIFMQFYQGSKSGAGQEG